MTDYFELYDLPLSFNPDAALVKKKFYELSRLYHPDRFIQAGNAQQQEALRMAALNNAAYKTLTNSDATMAYILKQQGLMEEEQKYSLPASFLGEMMDLNELVSEYETDPHNSALRDDAENSIEAELKAWQMSVDALLKTADGKATEKTLLTKVKDYYFRRKYLLRIKERIATFAAPE
ncbi:MAG: Fe-S protein assembly co-chaperone HscB [Taibaiella sp.]|nr:Fe-S protein assembly co-chaperone HscB [Taibaiella sp.]